MNVAVLVRGELNNSVTSRDAYIGRLVHGEIVVNKSYGRVDDEEDSVCGKLDAVHNNKAIRNIEGNRAGKLLLHNFMLVLLRRILLLIYLLRLAGPWLLWGLRGLRGQEGLRGRHRPGIP